LAALRQSRGLRAGRAPATGVAGPCSSGEA
jgi:hypothetical protein